MKHFLIFLNELLYFILKKYLVYILPICYTYFATVYPLKKRKR